MTAKAGEWRARRARSCPVCNTPNSEAQLFLEENIDPTRITEFSFASRKAPEHMSHRLMRCPTCDLVYVDQPPVAEELSQAYHQASYDSSEEADDAAAVYIRSFENVLPRLSKGRALEIGTGSGAFLEALLDAGFSEVVGVEPSLAAIASAPEHRRSWIREGNFEEGDFAPESFDLIVCFMTMEHVLEPGLIARAAHRLLRAGGAFVTVTHDYRSPANRILGRRSPIIDIEHMQLFSPKSIKKLFESAGYRDITSRAFVNRYSGSYWLRLLPVPSVMRSAVTRLAAASRIDRVKIGLNVGNAFTVGFK